MWSASNNQPDPDSDLDPNFVQHFGFPSKNFQSVTLFLVASSKNFGTVAVLAVEMQLVEQHSVVPVAQPVGSIGSEQRFGTVGTVELAVVQLSSVERPAEPDCKEYCQRPYFV